MNIWPFPIPSYEHTCAKCGQHMIAPPSAEAYCIYAMCEDGAKNHGNHNQSTESKES